MRTIRLVSRDYWEEAQAHKRAQQQLLWRHRGSAFCGVERTKGGIEPIKGLIRQFRIRRNG